MALLSLLTRSSATRSGFGQRQCCRLAEACGRLPYATEDVVSLHDVQIDRAGNAVNVREPVDLPDGPRPRGPHEDAALPLQAALDGLQWIALLEGGADVKDHRLRGGSRHEPEEVRELRPDLTQGGAS